MRLLKAVLLVLLILSVVSFGGEAEANDTRNRVLYKQINGTANIEYTAYIIPPSTSYIYGGGTASQGFNVNFEISKTWIETTNYIELPTFLPANYTEDIRYAAIWFGDLGTPLSVVSPVQETINGLNYLTKFKLSGSGLVPNTKYSTTNTGGFSHAIRTQDIIKPLSYASDYFGLFLNKNSGDKIGYGYPSSGNYNNFEPAIMRLRYDMDFYTPADDPSITISNVTTNKATISWNTNNTNPAGTSYTLKYQVLKENGDPANESDWLPNGSPDSWEIIPIDNQNATTALTTTAEVFQPDHTYRLTVQVNHIAGPQYNVYSDYVIFSTSADPAVRAAQEAAIAAQAAKKAAEDTVQYSLDAKDAAVQAQKTADSVLSQVNHSTYGLEAIYNKIDTNTLPDIKKVYNPQGATATNTSSYEVKINATGIKSNLRYRVTCDGFDSGWTDSDTIVINNLTTSGVKIATVLVSNNPINPDQGAIAEDSIRFFKL